MIYEVVVSTPNENGSAHFSPMGYRMVGEQIILSPFVPSITLENLRRERSAVLNFTDDVRIIAGCLTGQQTWPATSATTITGWRMGNPLAHKELLLERIVEDDTRPEFYFECVHEQTHAPFNGFNRAQAAVVEACILLSRLDWLPPAKVNDEISYLKIAVDKTAGPRELLAWNCVLDAIRAHPGHRLDAAIDS